MGVLLSSFSRQQTKCQVVANRDRHYHGGRAGVGRGRRIAGRSWPLRLSTYLCPEGNIRACALKTASLRDHCWIKWPLRNVAGHWSHRALMILCTIAADASCP
eukprot:s2674_g12.t1